MEKRNFILISGGTFATLFLTVRISTLRRVVFVFLFFGLFATTAAGEEVPAAKIVAQADEIRFPQRSFEVHVVITSTAAGSRETDVKEYDILSRGIDRTLVRTTAPAMDRGQVLLMRGRDLWAFLPSLSQPVRLALSQRLPGQVANGDLAAANFSGDYAPTVTGIETIKGQQYYVLELNAIDRSVTYQIGR